MAAADALAFFRGPEKMAADAAADDGISS